MRRLIMTLMRCLPLGILASAGGCALGITERQLMDFVSSTSIRVFVQTVVSVLEAETLRLVQ